MTRAIRASATPAREDRLFPGDIRQFSSGGTGIAFGAAGVLYALAHTGSGRCPEHEAWLFERAMAAPEPRLGFYDGLHGIAYVLDALGRRGEALAVLERAVASPLDQLSFALFDGLAGIGIALLRFARTTGDRRYRARAMALADRLATRPAASAAGRDRPAAGLMHGAAGIGLFFVRAFEDTGDRTFLDLAEAELARDLGRCLTAPDGSLQLDEGKRVLPYVAVGSAGIVLAIREFLAHRRNDAFAAAVAAIARAAEAEFVVQAGLFNGRAGLMALLVALGDDEEIAATARRALDRHVRRLAWHVLPYRDDIAFPGDQLHRLSMDLATGSAGVLLALQAAIAGSAETLLTILTP